MTCPCATPRGLCTCAICTEPPLGAHCAAWRGANADGQRPHRHRAQRTRQEPPAACTCGAVREAWQSVCHARTCPRYLTPHGVDIAECSCGAPALLHVGRHSGMPRCCVCYRSDTSGTPEHGTCQHGEVRP